MSDQVLAREIIARPPVRHASLSRRQLGLAGAALLIGIGAAWYGHHWWTVGRFIESTDDAYVGGDVTVIAPKVAGFIADVAVTDNQAVHAGDLLVKLDDRDYRAALAKAAAAVAGQQATLANLEANRRLQEAMIAQAQAELTATAAEITRAQVRRRSLSQPGAGSVPPRCSASSRRTPTTRRRSPPMPRRGRRWRRHSAGSTSSTRRSSRRWRHWPVRIADRDTAQLNLGYTELRAPIDGTVGNRSARTGAYATVGAQLISLVPAHGLWVDANFKESQLARMRAGNAGDDRRPMCCRAKCSTAMSRAWRRRPARCSACCRRRTPPATSPRSCSACRCA